MPITAGFADLHIVRKIRQTVRKWWAIELAAADETGFVVDHKAGKVVPPHNPICQTCLAGKEGFSRCNASVEKAIVQLQRVPDLPQRAGPCHLGLDIVAVPVLVDDVYQGAMFACGFLIGEDEGRRERILDRARALGVDEKVPDLDEAYGRIARLDERDLEYFQDLLAATASEVAVVSAQVSAREARIEALSAQLQERHRFDTLVGRGAAMQKLFAVLDRVVESEATVLVTGENGTGKELVARAIHFNGPRKDRPFVAQNCSALNDNLLESELFGHVKGAFTGATRDKPGLFKVADGGTLFLDEVADMSPAMQVKILRVLQEGSYVPLGGTELESVDVRVVAATNKPLAPLVQKRQFRQDLYYRLNVINVELPPLRDRLEDLPLLCDHFLSRQAERTGGPKKSLSPEVMAGFYAAAWPGNIRELENTLERLAVLAGDEEIIGPDVDDAPPGVRAPGERTLARLEAAGDLAGAVRNLEKELIEAGLVATHWNKSRLAARLGISRTTLIKKIRDYGLETDAE